MKPNLTKEKFNAISDPLFPIRLKKIQIVSTFHKKINNWPIQQLLPIAQRVLVSVPSMEEDISEQPPSNGIFPNPSSGKYFTNYFGAIAVLIQKLDCFVT